MGEKRQISITGELQIIYTDISTLIPWVRAKYSDFLPKYIVWKRWGQGEEVRRGETWQALQLDDQGQHQQS